MTTWEQLSIPNQNALSTLVRIGGTNDPGIIAFDRTWEELDTLGLVHWYPVDSIVLPTDLGRNIVPKVAIMTTPNHQPTAAQIAGELSAEEWVALEYVQTNGSYPINDEDKSLTNFDRVFLKGLLNKIYNQDRPRYFLNVYGNAVLEARASVPVVGKPATVTAETFYREYYAERINRGECDVWWEEDHSKVAYLRKMNVSPTLYEVYFVGEGGTFANVYPEREFTVTWLTPPQPATPQAANETAGGSGTWDIDKAYEDVVYKERNLHLALCAVLGIQFDSYPSPNIYVEAIKALRDQNAALRALCGRAADQIDSEGYIGDLVDDLRQAAKQE